MISFLLFFLDFFLFNFLEKWVFSLLLIGFIINQLKKDSEVTFFLRCFNFYVPLLLLEDFILNDRVGLAFCYIIPIILLAYFIRAIFLSYFQVFHYILLILSFLIQILFIKMYLQGKVIFWGSTILTILINIITMLVFLLFRNFLSKQGNYFFSRFRSLKKRGKSGLPTGRMP